MKALRLHGPRDLRLHDEPTPVPAEDEVLLRVTAVGLCGSDRHWLLEGGIGDAVLTRPLVLGHEFVGTIESGSRAGERVVVDPAIPCGRCNLCAVGRSNLCLDLRFAGHGSTDGALRTELAWPERLAHRLPSGVRDAEAALLEPLGVALHALDLGQIQPGVAAGVFGCGPIGLLLVQLLRLTGETAVLAADPLAHRLAAAQELGAVPTPAGAGVDVAFEVAGEDAALESAVDALRPGGRLVVVGIPADDRWRFTASTARRKELTILLCRRMQPTDLPRAIRLAEGGQVDLARLVSERHALTDWQDAFEALTDRRGLKVVIQP